MEKIQAIMKNQKFLYVFFAAVAVKIITSFITIPFVPVVSLILGIVSYVLIWIGYSTAKRFELKSTKKYLTLGILIPILTIGVGSISAYIGFKQTASMLGTMSIDETTSQEELTEMLTQQTSPEMQATLSVLNGVSIATEIIYLGLGIMIFLDNKDDLKVAELEREKLL